MGNPLGIFKNLTKAGIVKDDGTVQYFDSPGQQAQAIVSQQQAPEFTANADSYIPEQRVGAEYVNVNEPDPGDMGIYSDPPSPAYADHMDIAPEATPTAGPTGVMFDPAKQKSTSFAQSSAGKDVEAIHPSFNQQTTDQYGNVISGNNKGLTKGGLVVKMLKGGLMGAMDAIANGALNAPQHGESSFGMGMQAARQGPQIRQQEAIAKQQGEMQTAQMQDQMRPVQTKQGVMPLWKAVQLSKMTREEAAAAKDSALAEKALREPKPDMPDLQKLYADAVRRGDKVAAQNYADAIQNIQPEHAAPQDSKVGERVGPDNNKYVTYKKPDGKTYEVKVGAERAPANGGSGGSGTPTEIKPNSREFKVAQDMAYGRLTFQGFRTLYAYSRDASMKSGIYEMATRLNPNFNMAKFEMGYKLAASPKVQQQMASLDNVIQAAPDMLRASEEATRTGIKSVNKITNWAGIQFGGQKYSNFHTAQIAFADELSGALGYGSATDMSREMGLNMTDPNLSPDQFAAAMREVIVPFINRKRSTLLNQMSVYGEPGMNPAAEAPKTIEDVDKPKGGNKRNDGITFIR